MSEEFLELKMDTFNELKVYPIRQATIDDDWAYLRKDCGAITDWGQRILRSGLDSCVKSIVLEPHYTCRDHRNLYSNYYSKKFRETSQYTSRLHFFSMPDIDIDDLCLNPNKYTDSYIGYSVIRPVQERCLGRTVIDPWKLQKFNLREAFFLRTDFQVHIAGQHFRVEGFPYMSQDSDVTVCAHSALWCVCRYLSESYPLYKETYPFDLVNLTAKSEGRVYPHRGMTYSDYCSILSDFGCYPVVLRVKSGPKGQPEPEKIQDVYSYVESGFPVLASLWRHVVVLIGHTIDYNLSPTPDNGGYIDSSSYVKQYIVSDDNFFPYQLLGENGPPDNYGYVYPNGGYEKSSVVNAVCPLPEKVFLPVEEARRYGRNIFDGHKDKLEAIKSGPFITRLYLTTNTAFKRRKIYISSNKNEDKLCFVVSKIWMPHFVWVMEISTPDLYKQGLCIAEIAIDSTANVMEDPRIYLRIGNTLICGTEEKTYDEAPTVFQQYTHNLGET